MSVEKFDGDIASIDLHKIFVIDVKIELSVVLRKSLSNILNDKVNRSKKPPFLRNTWSQDS